MDSSAHTHLHESNDVFSLAVVALAKIILLSGQ